MNLIIGLHTSEPQTRGHSELIANPDQFLNTKTFRSVSVTNIPNNKGQKQFKCQVENCKKVYFSLYRLEIHFRVHVSLKIKILF